MTRWSEDEWERWKGQRDTDRKQRAATTRRVNHEEEAEQCTVFAWFHVAKWRGIPLAEIAYAIPNGTYLGGTDKQRAFQMVRLKRMGLQAGMLDWCLPIPSPPYAGLYVEMKRRHGGRTSDEQRVWLKRLRWLGYDTHVAEGADRVKLIVPEYLKGTGHPLVIGFAPAPEVDWTNGPEWEGAPR